MAAGFSATSLAGWQFMKSAQAAVPPGFYPPARNTAYEVTERPLSDSDDVYAYNNFYEFGSHKEIADTAQAMRIEPWTLTIEGMVENPLTLDFDDLHRRFPLEERIYRMRCVEAWAMTVPWGGFPLAALMKAAQPKSEARYVLFESAVQEDTMPGLKSFWYPWPYLEAITIEEAFNELTFMATGLYGEPLRKQNGAPIRLVLPWKYGFKSAKSIVRIRVVEHREKTFWEELQPREYGFWANVNPEIDHPRWSQATERLLSSGDRVPTLPYNGYAEQVAPLYAGLTEKLKDALYR